MNASKQGLGFNPEKLLRRGIREALAKKGFVYIKDSGVPAGSEWNIDNFDTGALENMVKAFNQFGAIVAEMHNSKQFNRIMAEDYSKIFAAIDAELKRRKQDIPDNKNSGGNNSDGNNAGGNGSSGSNNSSSSGSNTSNNQNQNGSGQNQGQGSNQNWILPAALASGSLLLLLTMR